VRILCILIAVLSLNGCSLLVPKFETPTLSVVDVQMLKSDIWEQRLKVRLRVQNPNDRILPVKGLEYTLEVDDQRFASGVSGASFVVPALGEAEFDMSVTANMASTLIKMLGRGSKARSDEVSYRITGKISLSQGLLRSIPFEQRGTFNLNNL